MAQFDSTILLYAIYVAFVYACLALGATAYRQIVDNLELLKINLGEDIYFLYDPMSFLIVAVLIVVFGILGFLALYIWEPIILAYVIPLAVGVNIVQIALRAHFQRLIVRTGGIVGRNIFNGKLEAVGYEQVLMGEVEREWMWDCVTLHYAHPTDKGQVQRFRRRLSHKSTSRVVTILESSTDAKIFRASQGARE